jgi:glucan phosphoethanolaminetransferase (alkaline phosphatase superfamily)
VRRRQTSIGQELVWLLIFFAIFVAVAAIVLRLAAAQHFNDRIAVTIAALLVGLIIIALRARFIGRNARSS